MKGLKILFCCIIIISFCPKIYGQYIAINETFSAQQLVENVLVNSPCATTSNWSLYSGNFASGEKSIAYFDVTSTLFPFQNGIVLSTGKAQNTIGPNTTLSDDGQNMGWAGDADLEQALGLSNSFNATVLEFDFSTVGNTISFDFIFSSEQYLSNPSSNQCNYTDGFAFLLKEVNATTYDNLALVPNTNIPVKVNTVRGSGTVCPAANEVYFDAFNGTEHPTNFNGQTKAMTAKADVISGATYHIKIVIADEGNARFDSAIFLRGGSFNFGLNLGNDRLTTLGNPLCFNETLSLNATQLGTNSYQWFKDDLILIGETNPTYTVVSEGNYTVEVNINGSCISKGSIEVEYAPDLNVIQSLFEKCDSDGTSDGFFSFDLSNIQNQIFSNLPGSFELAFFETTTSTIPLASNFTNTTANQQIVFAKITNIQGCYAAYPITLKVNTFSIGSDEVIGLCNNDTTDLYAPLGYISYSWNTNPIQNTNQISINTAGNYTVTATNADGCTAAKTFSVESSESATVSTIIVNDFSDLNWAAIEVTGNGTYVYSLNGLSFQSSNIFGNLQAGNYSYIIRDLKGCNDTIGTFQIMSAPRFFSPNDDGYNDLWQIPLLALHPNAKISIFDRFGQLIYSFKANQLGWDGKLNSRALPATDYWYAITFENGRIVQGHFSLIR
ncbi:choice-of-anchor L domain-containing protein [uncultured Flavobacterium sp.]|uniref:choice-of-anchor L domain-containing protein n=1 Tax=uncultured Flavobacterium sp. TaxID=165435 RepID=UPI0030CA1C3B